MREFITLENRDRGLWISAIFTLLCDVAPCSLQVAVCKLQSASCRLQEVSVDIRLRLHKVKSPALKAFLLLIKVNFLWTKSDILTSLHNENPQRHCDNTYVNLDHGGKKKQEKGEDGNNN